MISLAVIGAAHPHVTYALDELAYRDDVALVAVSDPDPDTADRYARPHHAISYTDHRLLLARHRPDVVMVAGVYAERAQAVVDSLEAGAQVLADKPLCTTLTDLAPRVDGQGCGGPRSSPDAGTGSISWGAAACGLLRS